MADNQSIQIQLRRGNNDQSIIFKGAQGELTMDLTNHNLRLHDNSKMGGYVIDKADDVVHKADTETISGEKTFSAITKHSREVIVTGLGSGSYGQFRAINGNYGFMIRNDGSSTYFLLTASGSQYGTWNDLRPLTINNSTGNVTCGTSWTFSQDIQGTATRAKWADLAENYQSDEKYPAGTLIKFGGEKDITIAHFGENCNGVISERPGFLLDNELEDGLPVALSGKTPVRVIGKVNKFDKLVLSPISGVAKVKTSGNEKVIAIALEASDNEEEKLVRCVTKFNLD